MIGYDGEEQGDRSMESRLSLPTRAAREIAARGASCVRRGIAGARILDGVVLCALIVIFALRLASAGVARLVAGSRAIAVLGFAAAIPLGAVGYQAQQAWHAEEIGIWAGTRDDGAEEFAGYNRWKRGVEQTLKEAEVREQARRHDEAKAEEARESAARAQLQAEIAPPPIDVGISEEVAALRAEREPQAETLNEQSKAASEAREAYAASPTQEPNAANPTNGTSGPVPFSNSPLTEDQEPVPMEAPPGPMTVPVGPASPSAAVPPEFYDGPPWHHMGGHGWGRGHWRGGRHRWAYFRLTGVGRGFPFVLRLSSKQR
jgi:hypothetical protein